MIAGISKAPGQTEANMWVHDVFCQGRKFVGLGKGQGGGESDRLEGCDLRANAGVIQLVRKAAGCGRMPDPLIGLAASGKAILPPTSPKVW